MEEIWKDVKGYEGLYQVSNLGRVRNVKYNIYCSQSQCGRELGLNSSNINRALKGGLRQVGGYVFEYA